MHAQDPHDALRRRFVLNLRSLGGPGVTDYKNGKCHVYFHIIKRELIEKMIYDKLGVPIRYSREERVWWHQELHRHVKMIVGKANVLVSLSYVGIEERETGQSRFLPRG